MKLSIFSTDSSVFYVEKSFRKLERKNALILPLKAFLRAIT